jgi:hypothetical protein
MAHSNKDNMEGNLTKKVSIKVWEEFRNTNKGWLFVYDIWTTLEIRQAMNNHRPKAAKGRSL